MKLRFESDAFFKKSVTVNKTLTASQIEEPISEEDITITYQKQEEAIISINLSTELPPIKHSFLFDLTLPSGAFNLLVINCKARITYNEIGSGLPIPKEEIANAQTIADKQAQTINASVRYAFPDNASNPQIKFILQYSYSLNEIKTSNSYFDKTSLYGENGILRDIQNRLENLKSNFEAMGFEYDVNDEFSSSIDTLNVNNATIRDVILPKNAYDDEITSLVDIIADINDRLEPLGSVEEGEIYHNDGYIIGNFYKIGDVILVDIKTNYVTTTTGSRYAYFTLQQSFTIEKNILATISYGTANLYYNIEAIKNGQNIEIETIMTDYPGKDVTLPTTMRFGIKLEA